jgi:hypothetical protein
MKNLGWVSLGLVFSFGVAACGEADDGEDGEGGDGTTGELEQGFVACGDTECQPGQFCKDASLSYCELGCQSNNNCAADQSCEEISDVTHVGTCMQAAGPTDQLARCKDACSQMVSCQLLTAAEGSQCQSECAGASEATQRSVADCVSPWMCESPLPACLGIECGGAYECPGSDQSCVDGTCL